MFVDECRLTFRAGDGGNGLVAWRREKRVPRGGPAGGDGGNGGDVVLVADTELTTFGDMEDVRTVRAEHGQHGGRNKCTGRAGRDRVFHLPPGTTIYDVATGERLIDLAEPGQRWIAGRGGRGGRGNAHFASATDRRPTRSEPGGTGEERTLRLQLRLLADVGLIGLPNAGKSTLLSRLSAARPRIASYPFTTLGPHLGLVEAGDLRFVMADLPGLIEGAHRGHGLGDRFLRHVERTRVLVHLVDLAPIDGENPEARYRTIREEILRYGRDLAARPEILVGTKAELLDKDQRDEVLSRLAAEADREVIAVSAVTGEGLETLLGVVAKALATAPPPPEVPDRVVDEGGARSDPNPTSQSE